ncbi:MAG: metallophosphoesterase [Paludibacteraceae bacterium]
MRKNSFFIWFRNLSLLPGVLFIIAFFYIRFGLLYSSNYLLTSRISWIFVVLSLIYTPKILYIIFYYLNRLYNSVFNKRTRILRIIGFSLGITLVAVISYGVIVTRDNFYLKEQVVEVKDLPENFDGYRIAIFSDIHLGNWNRKYKIMKPIVNLINKTNADVIIFCGDMINNFNQETEGWEPYFAQLKSKYGMYAVLGNHDYGDYTHWNSKEEKNKNLEKTKQNIRDLGFRLLLNEHTNLVKGSDTITLIGVENYGSGHFDKHSDLKKALNGTYPKKKKILITHDPNHWNAEVIGLRPDIFLSLSGHTHAGQIGFSRGKIHISPASLIYPEWDGLYQNKNQFLYVNRGIGYVGIPIRIGVPPEITLIILKRK